MIGGLIHNRESETFQRFHSLATFRSWGSFSTSKTKNKTNTELMVMVTLEIVAPIEAGARNQCEVSVKFLPPNSNNPMNQPDAKTAANTPVSPPPTIPVETLIQSMRPRSHL